MVTTMRSALFFALVSVAGFWTAPAWPVTPDELRALSGVTEREEQQRANRAKTSDPKTLLPVSKEPVRTTPQSSKYGTASTPARSNASGIAARENGREAASDTAGPGSDDSDYIPPPRSGTGTNNAIYSDSVPVPKQRFGIRLGQWLEAALERNSSSAEPGLVELRMTADVVGDKRTLRTGTLLYASKGLNGGTKRLEMQVTKGITPDGHEFTMKGLIFDAQKVSGLNGIMQIDNSQIAKHSGTNAALAAVAAGARGLARTSPFGAAATSATETAITDTNRSTEFNTSLREVIYVSPQPVLIRVEEMF